MLKLVSRIVITRTPLPEATLLTGKAAEVMLAQQKNITHVHVDDSGEITALVNSNSVLSGARAYLVTQYVNE